MWEAHVSASVCSRHPARLPTLVQVARDARVGTYTVPPAHPSLPANYAHLLCPPPLPRAGPSSPSARSPCPAGPLRLRCPAGPPLPLARPPCPACPPCLFCLPCRPTPFPAHPTLPCLQNAAQGPKAARHDTGAAHAPLAGQRIEQRQHGRHRGPRRSSKAEVRARHRRLAPSPLHDHGPLQEGGAQGGVVVPAPGGGACIGAGRVGGYRVGLGHAQGLR